MLSLAAGSAAAVVSKNFVESRIAFYRNQLDKTEPMTQVVVPKRKLHRGEIVNASMLSLREIPTRYADSQSVTRTSFESAVGQQLNFDLDEGRPLLWAHLESGKTYSFSGRVPSGFRAMTVPVDEINSISGFLQPGDRIDFLLAHRHTGIEQIFPLIENLLVVATGVQTSADESSRSGGRAFSTITVMVTPDQAKKLGLSRQVGELTAVLRNPADNTTLSASPLSALQMINGASPSPGSIKRINSTNAKPVSPRIEYIIGGS